MRRRKETKAKHKCVAVREWQKNVLKKINASLCLRPHLGWLVTCEKEIPGRRKWNRRGSGMDKKNFKNSNSF